MSNGPHPPQQSPWRVEFQDYQQKFITITVTFDNTSRALITAVVHRDTGCVYHTIVFDVPSSGTAKRLAAPADGAGDATYTAAQMASQGLTTIEQAMALQITAEP